MSPLTARSRPRKGLLFCKGNGPLPVVPTPCGIDVVPSCLDLSAAESELLHEPGRELILKGLVDEAVDRNRYDYLLVDCPPMLGLLTLNALTLADYLIIPVQAEYLAMRGMAKILSSVQVVKQRLNARLQVPVLSLPGGRRRNRSTRFEDPGASFHAPRHRHSSAFPASFQVTLFSRMRS